MSRQHFSALLFALLLFTASPLLANNLIMVRTVLPLEQVATGLKTVVADHGYIVLDDKNFGEQRYSVVTVENRTMNGDLLTRYPMLAPFLPWRIALIVENGTTLLVSLNPLYLEHHFPNSGPIDFLRQSSRDLRKILLNVGEIKP